MLDLSMAQDTSYTAGRVFHSVAPDRVYSGADCISEVPNFLARLGRDRVLIATSNSVHNRTPLTGNLRALLSGKVVGEFSGCRQHSPEQDIFDLMEAVQKSDADVVVSIGGSSVFDTVKVALSRLASEGADGILPQLAIPTTLSAGEFTPGAGYTRASDHSKQLVMDRRAAPRAVFLDPTCTLYTPDELWCGTGLKALDHAIEAVWSVTPHPYADALALEAIRLLLGNLPRSRSQDDLDARAACQIGAWMSIVGAGSSGMRLSHFLGHQIGAAMDLPHGITSCVLLPGVMRYLAPKTGQAQIKIAEAMGVAREDKEDAAFISDAADHLESFIAGLDLPTSISAAGGNRKAMESAIVASNAAAETLGLTQDLPEGEASVRKVLESVW